METVARLAADPAAWAALATLIAMEIVLGVDNLVFIALLSNRVEESRRRVRAHLGLSLALVFRLALLGSAAAIVHLTTPLAIVFGHPFSVRDLLLLAGGLFLVWKATTEIHERVEPDHGGRRRPQSAPLGVGSAHRPDRAHRHRVFRRQHHHSGRHDQRVSDHGRSRSSWRSR